MQGADAPGRFLDEIDADELVFGNLFQKPIKDRLPWGTSIAIKAMQSVYLHSPDSRRPQYAHATKRCRV